MTILLAGMLIQELLNFGMPEGPSIVILKEEVSIFKGLKVIQATGTAKIEINRLNNKKILDFKSWGKHLLICFKGFTVRVHLLLFGSYRINQQREFKPRLALKFKTGELNFYNCSVKIIEGNLNKMYDWSVDLMSDKWSKKEVMRRLLQLEDTLLCDALLNQEVFAGSGNIIKNEVLFRTRIHPATPVKGLLKAMASKLVQETRKYCFLFLKWKKAFKLKKHWRIYRASICPRCHIPVTRSIMGETMRKTFFCSNCQKLY